MRIEKWEAGTSADRECPAMVEFLFIEGDAHDGEGIPVPAVSANFLPYTIVRFGADIYV